MRGSLVENIFTGVFVGFLAALDVFIGSPTVLGAVAALVTYSMVGSVVFLFFAILTGELNDRRNRG